MKVTTHPSRFVLAALSTLCLASTACRPQHAPSGALPPAYTSNQITDPALLEVAEEIQSWAAGQTDTGQKSLYGRIEVVPPVPIVQPYGVGVFQQEMRLPVILTTGPGWSTLNPEEKEKAVAQAFRHIAERLQGLDHKPALQPTLTVQTPQGMELTWMNRLDPGGKNVHGDD